MSTLKAFGISCVVVIGMCAVFGVLYLSALWSPIALGTALVSMLLTIGTLMLKDE